MKKCTSCHELKPKSNFHKKLKGIDSICPDCKKINIRKFRNQKRFDNLKETLMKRQVRVIEFYVSNNYDHSSKELADMFGETVYFVRQAIEKYIKKEDKETVLKSKIWE